MVYSTPFRRIVRVEDVLGAAEARPPQLVAHDGNRAGALVAGAYAASARGVDAENRKEVRRHPRHLDSLGERRLSPALST